MSLAGPYCRVHFHLNFFKSNAICCSKRYIGFIVGSSNKYLFQHIQLDTIGTVTPLNRVCELRFWILKKIQKNFKKKNRTIFSVFFSVFFSVLYRLIYLGPLYSIKRIFMIYYWYPLNHCGLVILTSFDREKQILFMKVDGKVKSIPTTLHCAI